MEETPNLKLKKPGLTDNVLISDFNENADVLDMEIGGLKTGLAGKEEAGVAQDAVEALAGAGNTKTVKQLDTELREHKDKNASSTEAGHMTAADKKKLNGIEEGANKYTHPAAHPATMITEDATHRFVTDAEKTNWNGKETPAGAQEKVDALAGPGNTKTVKQLDDALATHLADGEAHGIGKRSNLKTVAKNTIVQALNEVHDTKQKAIYIQSTAPLNPVDGDIWIEVE